MTVGLDGGTTSSSYRKPGGRRAGTGADPRRPSGAEGPRLRSGGGAGADRPAAARLRSPPVAVRAQGAAGEAGEQAMTTQAKQSRPTAATAVDPLTLHKALVVIDALEYSRWDREILE